VDSVLPADFLELRLDGHVTASRGELFVLGEPAEPVTLDAGQPFQVGTALGVSPRRGLRALLKGPSPPITIARDTCRATTRIRVERFLTEDKLVNALTSFGSWHREAKSCVSRRVSIGASGREHGEDRAVRRPESHAGDLRAGGEGNRSGDNPSTLTARSAESKPASASYSARRSREAGSERILPPGCPARASATPFRPCAVPRRRRAPSGIIGACGCRPRHTQRAPSARRVRHGRRDRAAGRSAAASQATRAASFGAKIRAPTSPGMIPV
jgi:hypothetical protein